jgi:hypothetical protein
MKAEEIPPELTGILDRAAGMNHSRTGSVMRALAEILTRYDEIRSRTEMELRLRAIESYLGIGPVLPGETRWNAERSMSFHMCLGDGCPCHPSMNGGAGGSVPGAGGGHHGQ